MRDQDDCVLSYGRYARLDGSIERVSIGKRNGKSFPILPPAMAKPLHEEEQFLWEQERSYVNLNPVERETWRKLLGAQSISSIAKEEGVSRAAIYARILGNRKGHGGMIGKNFWVLLWWRLRRRQTGGTDL
jgi:hypothetical protein